MKKYPETPEELLNYQESKTNKNNGFAIVCNTCGRNNEVESCPSGAVWIECECGNRWGD